MVIDEMLPQIKTDSAWPRHVLGSSTHLQRLSALQFYAYSFLESTDAERANPSNESTLEGVAKYRKAITILRNTSVWPSTRAPLPALYQQYAVACLEAKRYNEALIAMLRLHLLIDPTIYSQQHHPVRVVHAWTLATLAKAVGSDEESPFCQALKSCEVDLSLLFVALLNFIHEQVPKSHGTASIFGRMLNGVWQTMMGPGGDLESQYAQAGIKRHEWRGFMDRQVKELWPKVIEFAENEGIAKQIDEALLE